MPQFFWLLDIYIYIFFNLVVLANLVKSLDVKLRISICNQSWNFVDNRSLTCWSRNEISQLNSPILIVRDRCDFSLTKRKASQLLWCISTIRVHLLRGIAKRVAIKECYLTFMSKLFKENIKKKIFLANVRLSRFP